MIPGTEVKAKQIKIYLVIDPISHGVQYVGKTNKTIAGRMKNHRTQNTTLTGYLKELADLGLKPVVIVIDICTDDNWQEREIYWIDFYRKINGNLLNIADGGFGVSGVKLTAEVIEAMKERLCVPVFCKKIKTGEVSEFKSRTKAAEYFEVDISAIVMTIKRQNAIKGHLLSNTHDFKQTYASMRYRKAVYHIDPTGTKTLYDSCKAAGKTLGLDGSFISKVARGIHKQYKGQRFEFVD